MFFSFQTLTCIVSFSTGGYSSPQELKNQRHALQKTNESKRVATYYYFWLANHTRYIIYMRTNAHTNFSVRGGRNHDFRCINQYIAITANPCQDQPHDIKTNTYHENVDSSSTGSTYDQLLLYIENEISFQRLPNQSTEQQYYCNPTKLNQFIDMLRTNTPVSGQGGERGGSTLT